jgi:hypothetical protein
VPARAQRLGLAGAVFALTLVTAEAARAETWSQWSTPAVSGVGQGATKLGIGVDWAHVPGDHSLRLAGDFEHMLRDRIGLVGRAALPIDGAWVAPATLGLRFHLLPLSPLDPYVGGGGGLAWMRFPGRDARIDPTIDAEAGLTFHYWGLFYLEAGVRYDLVRYSAPDAGADLSGLVVGGRSGVYF